MRLISAVPLLLAAALLASCQSKHQGASGDSALCAPYGAAQLANMNAEAQVAWLTQRIDECKLDKTARANDFYNRGTAQLEMKRYDLAAADADATLKILPQDSRAFALRCLARMGLTENDAAVVDCQQAATLSSNNPVMLALYGKAQARNGQPQAALETLRTAAKNPDALKAIQQELADKGYYNGAVDGIYGKGTEGALKTWIAAGAP